METLEKGSVLEVGYSLHVDENYNVYAVSEKGSFMIPVGSCKHNLIWFKESSAPLPEEIKRLVYLGDYQWSFKHFQEPINEFKELSEGRQVAILSTYFSQKEDIIMLRNELYRDDD